MIDSIIGAAVAEMFPPNGPTVNPQVNHQPQYQPRVWVGLTKKEKRLFSSWLDHKSDDEVFSAIEAKLKEKNT